jgi:hypothetical protein
MQEGRRRADSVTAVAGATGPVRLGTSAHDDTVAPAQTSAFAAALRAGGKAATDLLAWLQARFLAD